MFKSAKKEKEKETSFHEFRETMQWESKTITYIRH